MEKNVFFPLQHMIVNTCTRTYLGETGKQTNKQKSFKILRIIQFQSKSVKIQRHIIHNTLEWSGKDPSKVYHRHIRTVMSFLCIAVNTNIHQKFGHPCHATGAKSGLPPRSWFSHIDGHDRYGWGKQSLGQQPEE